MTIVTAQRPALTALREGHHPLALRAPWYVGERAAAPYDRFDPRALPPTIQKYDTADLVRRVMADPRDSLTYTSVDEWSVVQRRTAAEISSSSGRLRFATHEFKPMGIRKLFQPNHERFYAVVVEVFCDHDGLPRPRPDDTFSVALVVRRQVLSANLTERQVRRLARDVIRGRAVPAATPVAPVAVTGRQGWMSDGHGGQGWVDVDDGGRPLATPRGVPDDEQHLLLDDALTEQVVPMWRIPTDAAQCDAATGRSLWFGLVPTFSGDHETAFAPTLPVPSNPGATRYDDRATYEIRCRASRPTVPGREDCPPDVYWSAPTAPYRLAAFFDPEGTKNRTVSITMPDLRAVAARAGQPAGGGVAITTPPGSQLTFDPDNGTPGSPDLPPGGAVAQTCTFAVELFSIVAMFVFSLFLPIVMFLFQLWWLLLLKFCLPPIGDAMGVLRKHFHDGGTLATMGAAQQQALDGLLGGKGATARLQNTAVSKFDPANAEQLVEALDPAKHADPTPAPPEAPVSDPLCPLPSP